MQPQERVSSLVLILADKNGSWEERDDAAMDLGALGIARADVVDVLVRVGSDPTEDAVLRQSAGESLGDVLRGRADAKTLLEQLLPDARTEAVAALERSAG